MYRQHYISLTQYEGKEGLQEPLPTAADIEQPEEPPAAPYFTSWLQPQVISAMERGGVPAKVAEYRAYYGGLKIRTTIDLRMQQAAQEAITQDLPQGPGLPAASLVAIDNKTGQVRAMVGGPLTDGQENFQKYPFNLATEGFRQPGSAFKPFTLAVALEHGYGPSSVFDSKPLDLIVPNSGGKEHYMVKNFGNEYSGPISLATATDVSDNSVFTQLGLSPGVGTKNISKMANRMGIRSPVSTNYAMIIGGLRQGVTTLDMAHAYETIATGGLRVYSPGLGAPNEGPVGVAQIQCLDIKCRGKRDLYATPHYSRVLPASVAAAIHELLQGVVAHGTGTAAAISGVDVAGKTGTTSNYGDAWFVGWTPQMTTAVWVGYPNKLVPMTTLYNGQPVEGGTFPANIWHDFMVQALQINAQEAQEYGRHPHKKNGSGSSGTGTGTVGTGDTGTGIAPTAPPAGGTGTAGNTGGRHVHQRRGGRRRHGRRWQRRRWRSRRGRHGRWWCDGWRNRRRHRWRHGWRNRRRHRWRDRWRHGWRDGRRNRWRRWQRRQRRRRPRRRRRRDRLEGGRAPRRPRYVPVARRQEAPGQVSGLGDPDPHVDLDGHVAPGARPV